MFNYYKRFIQNKAGKAYNKGSFQCFSYFYQYNCPRFSNTSNEFTSLKSF